VNSAGDALIRYLESWAAQQATQTQQQQARRMADSVAHAVRKHPEFLAARAALNSSREGVDEARAAWWPQVSGNTGFGSRTTSGVSVSTPSYGFTISQLLFDFGNTSAKVDAAETRVQGAVAGLDKKQALVVMRAVSAWHELYRARKLMELHRLNVQARQDIVAFIKERADLGAARPAMFCARAHGKPRQRPRSVRPACASKPLSLPGSRFFKRLRRSKWKSGPTFPSKSPPCKPKSTYWSRVSQQCKRPDN